FCPAPRPTESGGTVRIVGTRLATLPISIFVVGMAACIPPAGAIARRYGRRAAFLAGTAGGVADRNSCSTCCVHRLVLAVLSGDVYCPSGRCCVVGRWRVGHQTADADRRGIVGGRRLGIIARQPLFVTAMICGAVSYMLMNFLMTAAPLAMTGMNNKQARAVQERAR